jgi:hypothetical protein
MTSSWSSLENLSSRALMLPSNRKPSTAGLRALGSICFSHRGKAPEAFASEMISKTTNGYAKIPK